MTDRDSTMFTPEERLVLDAYRHPGSSDTRRAVRLSLQYLIGAGIFAYAAIAVSPWFAVLIWLEFAAFAAIRLRGARRVAGIMPGILAKYERRLAELEGPADRP
ncbi:hypothetical protein TA3x_005538 [Tundrisphaera sp. TA3]|uniref:hypothetical protein n=1 Tax=Tundrisphaera sp. TA3 TaxID=3435775 RepID=UPI003EBA3E3A